MKHILSASSPLDHENFPSFYKRKVVDDEDLLRDISRSLTKEKADWFIMPFSTGMWNVVTWC